MEIPRTAERNNIKSCHSLGVSYLKNHQQNVSKFRYRIKLSNLKEFPYKKYELPSQKFHENEFWEQ